MYIFMFRYGERTLGHMCSGRWGGVFEPPPVKSGGSLTPSQLPPTSTFSPPKGRAGVAGNMRVTSVAWVALRCVCECVSVCVVCVMILFDTGRGRVWRVCCMCVSYV